MLTPSRTGDSPFDFLVITVILWPDSANFEDRWKTVDPMPPHLGGYSPEIIAMCMVPDNRSREPLLKSAGVSSHYNGSKIGP